MSTRTNEALAALSAKVDAILTSPEVIKHALGDQATIMGLALILGTIEIYQRIGKGGAYILDEDQVLADVAKVNAQLDDALTSLQLATMPNRGAA